jgi:hypothetical protein
LSSRAWEIEVGGLSGNERWNKSVQVDPDERLQDKETFEACEVEELIEIRGQGAWEELFGEGKTEDGFHFA